MRQWQLNILFGDQYFCMANNLACKISPCILSNDWQLVSLHWATVCSGGNQLLYTNTNYKIDWTVHTAHAVRRHAMDFVRASRSAADKPHNRVVLTACWCERSTAQQHYNLLLLPDNCSVCCCLREAEMLFHASQVKRHIRFHKLPQDRGRSRDWMEWCSHIDVTIRFLPISSRVSPRKMRKHHGTWWFGTICAPRTICGAHSLGGLGGMLPLEIWIRKPLYMHFGGL